MEDCQGHSYGVIYRMIVELSDSGILIDDSIQSEDKHQEKYRVRDECASDSQNQLQLQYFIYSTNITHHVPGVLLEQ